jgi:hypothetical protein
MFVRLSINARISGDHMVSEFDFRILGSESMLEKHVMVVGVSFDDIRGHFSVVFQHLAYFET